MTIGIGGGPSYRDHWSRLYKSQRGLVAAPVPP